MDFLQALILGIIQGITEFFPISSSAHLKIIKNLMGISVQGEEMVFFDLCCHAGTAVALFIYLRRDVMALLWVDRIKGKRLMGALICMLPMYWVMTLVSKGFFHERYLGGSLIATSCLLFAFPLLLRKLRIKGFQELKFKDACWVMLAQGIALIPGISRSAVTIGTALWRGMPLTSAVSLSFIISLPAVIGGLFIEYWKIPSSASIPSVYCFIGFLSALMIGLGVVSRAFSILERGIFAPFAGYCFIIGLLISFYL